MNNNIKLINTGKCNILAVMVPDGAWKFGITSGDRNLHYKIGTIRHIQKLPEGNWQILGLSTGLTESQWREVIKRQSTFGNDYYYYDIKAYKTAEESGISLLEANQCFSVNPYGSKEDVLLFPEYGCPSWIKNAEKWQKAQENTGAWLILAPLK